MTLHNFASASFLATVSGAASGIQIGPETTISVQSAVIVAGAVFTCALWVVRAVQEQTSAIQAINDRIDEQHEFLKEVNGRLHTVELSGCAQMPQHKKP